MARRRAAAERGAGLVLTLAGVAVFLVLLLFAAQVLIGLYAKSMLTSAAFDAARTVAGAASAGEAGATTQAETSARARLGGFGRRVAFTWREVGPDRIVLEVQAAAPQFLPLHIAPLTTIDRTVIVRVERFR